MGWAEEVDEMIEEHAGVNRRRAMVDELLRQKDVQPIQAPQDPDGRDIFETAGELREFVEYTYAARHAELA